MHEFGNIPFWYVTMELRFRIVTGWPSRLNLRRRISAYTRQDRVYWFKIGVTSNPEGRAAAYGDEYDEMIILYKTQSEKNARELERILVEDYRTRADNLRGG